MSSYDDYNSDSKSFESEVDDFFSDKIVACFLNESKNIIKNKITEVFKNNIEQKVNDGFDDIFEKLINDKEYVFGIDKYDFKTCIYKILNDRLIHIDTKIDSVIKKNIKGIISEKLKSKLNHLKIEI